MDDIFEGENEQLPANDSDDVDKSPEGDTSGVAQTTDQGVMSDEDKALLKRIQTRIRDDKKHFEKDFKRMRDDMAFAEVGHGKDWPEANYKANIVGRHIRQKTNALYAKNPRAVARRKETLDFQIWDETSVSLQVAMQTIAAAQAAAQQGAALAETGGVDPTTGQTAPQPQMPPGFDQAQATIADFQVGMQRREAIKKIGKTLEILFAQAVKDQKPLDFKMAMKQLVRRACTTGVGYVKVGFQREMGPRTGLQEHLADSQERLAHLARLMEEQKPDDDDAAFDSVEGLDAEKAELEKEIAALQAEPDIVMREGLVFDYPLSTRVIPHKRCTSLVGFVNSRWLTIEDMYDPEEVEEIFGVEPQKYTEYLPDGTKVQGSEQGDLFNADTDEHAKQTKGLVCVWTHYDRASGLVYYVADGVDKWLRAPASPDVMVDDFWPVYALTFNAVESEDSCMPRSDVSLIRDIQDEYNRSRHGKREHRKVARPRWVTANGILEDEDAKKLGSAPPFSVIPLNVDPTTDLSKVLAALPVPGVDPNLYDVNEIMSDLQYTVGTQQAMLGGTSKATATESSIAAASASATDQSSIDDLDAFLTSVVRAAGQIMMREMSEEQVQKIVGPGAFWPQQTVQDILEDIYLEVEAGSSGKPNQAAEINNWKNMLPFLIQMPSINAEWLARETLRRLDDRMDLTEAVTSNAASIVSMNRSPGPTGQAAPPGAGGPPEAQGAHGVQKAAPAPQKETGSGPAFGSNQV